MSIFKASFSLKERKHSSISHNQAHGFNEWARDPSQSVCPSRSNRVASFITFKISKPYWNDDDGEI